jgi:hypothetical protein
MSKQSSDGGGGQASDRGHPEPASERPVPEPPAPAREPEGVNLSLEEKGMVVAPAVPVPTNEVDVGGMPGADASPGEGGGSEGGSSGSSGDE